MGQTTPSGREHGTDCLAGHNLISSRAISIINDSGQMTLLIITGIYDQRVDVDCNRSQLYSHRVSITIVMKCWSSSSL